MEELYSNKLFIHCKQAAFLETVKTMNNLTWKQKIALKFHNAICGACKTFSRKQHIILQKISEQGNSEIIKECMCNDRKNKIQQQLIELQTHH